MSIQNQIQWVEIHLDPESESRRHLTCGGAAGQFDEQFVSINIKRRVAVNICLGRYPVVARRCLASYTPRLAELQVEGGNVGLNEGSAATCTPQAALTP